MNPLLQVSEKDIEQLYDEQLADIMNRLLKAEAQRYGIPPLSVQTTLHVNAPDRGIDARVEHSVSLPMGCRIPEGLSVWQYKVGNVTPKKIREKESRKPGVQDAIQAGGSYCFVIGQGYAPDGKPRNERKDAVNHCYIEKGLTPKGRLYTAQEIADWVSDYPSVAMQPCFSRPVHDGLLTFDHWENLSQLRVRYLDFEIDHNRQSIIKEMGEAVNNRTGFLHMEIVGRAGVGKTRLALEAVRANALQYGTLYAISPQVVPTTLFSYVEANPNVRLVLVVDECTFRDFMNLDALAQRCGDRLVLITIRHERMALEANTAIPLFWLNGLDDKAMGRIVHNIVPPGTPRELIPFVVEASSGYVKLATAITESIARNPGLIGAAQLAGVPDVRVILESLVPNLVDRRAMEALSLSQHIGLDGDAAEEGRAVANFIGIDFRELKRVAEEMQQSGLVVKRGRYRYVTPHLLAVWFATTVWRARGEDIVNELLLGKDGLPTLASKEALLERLADLGEEEIAAPFVERLLGPDGLFPDVEAIDESLRSRIFAILAEAAPKAGAAALERVLGHLPRDRLLKFQAGRRQVIWTLEKLLSLEDTFWAAARLLLKLAEAENETYANSATGTWRGIFLTHLSGTPIPAIERHRLIIEAFDSPRVETRLLAVRAIQTALSLFESRMRGSGVGGHIIPAEWHPETWGELREARGSALKLLDRALVDQDAQVVEAAREVLTSTAIGLASQGLVDDVLPRLRGLPLRTDTERQDMWELLQRLLRHQVEALTEEQRETIEQWAATLVGDSYHDRLRRWVGKGTLVDHQVLEDSGTSPEKMAASIADEGYQNPDALRTELEWLASPDAIYFYFFGRRLGQLDTGHMWLEDLAAQVLSRGNPGLLTAYLHGRTDAGEGEWVEQLLDDWTKNKQDLASAAFDATWRRGGSERGAMRVISLVDKGWIPPIAISQLAWGGWVNSLPTGAMSPLLQRLTQDQSPHAAEGALSLLLRWLEIHPEQSEAMANYALELLERPSASRSQGMSLFYWKQVAKWYSAKYPSRIAQTILNLFVDSDFLVIPQDDRMEILKNVLLNDPETVWTLIGEVLLRQDDAGYRLQLSMSELGIEEAGIPLLLEWSEKHRPVGARILARIAYVGGVPLASLARQLLVKYGRDEAVSGSLRATYRSGGWVGPETQWLQGKLELARNWLNDEDTLVRDWAKGVVRKLEADIKRVQQQEEEEELWY